ncbi:MAG: Rne/Rng family ribonuclease [Candidatus Omnitrophica bacterium]|nr:Rne/Rng family ribonuclease [Candidatus Omnitrophota bacterium]
MKKKEILINYEQQERRVAILEDNRLENYFVERAQDRTTLGNIYKGKVETIVPSVGAAFVNVGGEKNGFLYLNDTASLAMEEEIDVGNGGRKAVPPVLKEGQELIVQVTKEPFGTKGPRLTTHISLPGRYLVLMPFEKHFGISKRIDDEAERRRLRSILEELKIPQSMGLIIRTVAWGATGKELHRDLALLLRLWENIEKASKKRSAPFLIYEDYDLVLRMLRDYFNEEIGSIWIDSKEEFKRVLRFVKSYMGRLAHTVLYYREKAPLFEKKGIEQDIERLYSSKVFLKSGAYIVIEPTEGLTVIDVNSGKFRKRNISQEEMAFAVNSESAREIARQLKLRDVGGIIVIDFIDMMEERHRREMVNVFKSALASDRAKTDILGLSKLGLVQMTRERTHRTLESISYQDCPYCHGKGKVKSAFSIAVSAMRELKNHLSNTKAHKVMLEVNSEVAASLNNENFQALRNIGRRFGARVEVKANQAFHIEKVVMS